MCLATAELGVWGWPWTLMPQEQVTLGGGHSCHRTPTGLKGLIQTLLLMKEATLQCFLFKIKIKFIILK